MPRPDERYRTYESEQIQLLIGFFLPILLWPFIGETLIKIATQLSR